jgi:hypothetical protein
MARAATGDTVTVAPTNNIYTALAAVAVLSTLMAVVVLFIRSQSLGMDLLK